MAQPPKKTPSTWHQKRAEKSRKAIARAAFDLITEGNPLPTSLEIAKRAGVSERLVFHYYTDMEAIHQEVTEYQAYKLAPLLIIKVKPEWPFEDRLTRFVNKRARLLEAINPMRKAALLWEHNSPLVADALEGIRKFKREQISLTFIPELSAFAEKEAALRELAIQNAASWNSWDTLRHHQNLSQKKAKAVMSTMIRAILSP